MPACRPTGPERHGVRVFRLQASEALHYPVSQVTASSMVWKTRTCVSTSSEYASNILVRPYANGVVAANATLTSLIPGGNVAE